MAGVAGKGRSCVMSKPKVIERIDKDDKGRLDDVVITDVSTFHMEWMDEDCVWIRLYRDKEGLDDIVFYLRSKRAIRGMIERERE